MSPIEQPKNDNNGVEASSLVKEGHVETNIDSKDVSTETLNKKFSSVINIMNQHLIDLKVSPEDQKDVQNLVNEILSRFSFDDQYLGTFALCLQDKAFVQQLVVFQNKFKHGIDKVDLINGQLIVTGNSTVDFGDLFKNLGVLGEKSAKGFVNVLSYVALGTFFAGRNISRWISADECHSQLKYNKTQGNFFAQLLAGVPTLKNNEQFQPIMNVNKSKIIFSEKIENKPSTETPKEKAPSDVIVDFFEAYNGNPFVSGKAELTQEYQNKLFKDFSSLQEFVSKDPSLIPVLQFSVGVDGQKIDLTKKPLIDDVYQQLSSKLDIYKDPKITKFLENVKAKALTNLKQPSEIYGNESLVDKQKMFDAQVTLILNRAMGTVLYLKQQFPDLDVQYSDDVVVTQGEQHGYDYDYATSSASERKVDLTLQKLERKTTATSPLVEKPNNSVQSKKSSTVLINGKLFTIEG